MTQEEVEGIATAAGRAASRDTLIAMGVDPDDPKEMQADFAYLRRNRIGAEKSWVYFVGAVIGGAITLAVTWLNSLRHP